MFYKYFLKKEKTYKTLLSYIENFKYLYYNDYYNNIIRKNLYIFYKNHNKIFKDFVKTCKGVTNEHKNTF